MASVSLTPFSVDLAGLSDAQLKKLAEDYFLGGEGTRNELLRRIDLYLRVDFPENLDSEEKADFLQDLELTFNPENVDDDYETYQYNQSGLQMDIDDLLKRGSIQRPTISQLAQLAAVGEPSYLGSQRASFRNRPRGRLEPQTATARPKQGFPTISRTTATPLSFPRTSTVPSSFQRTVADRPGTGFAGSEGLTRAGSMASRAAFAQRMAEARRKMEQTESPFGTSTDVPRFSAQRSFRPPSPTEGTSDEPIFRPTGFGTRPTPGSMGRSRLLSSRLQGDEDLEDLRQLYEARTSPRDFGAVRSPFGAGSGRTPPSPRNIGLTQTPASSRISRSPKSTGSSPRGESLRGSPVSTRTGSPRAALERSVSPIPSTSPRRPASPRRAPSPRRNVSPYRGSEAAIAAATGSPLPRNVSPLRTSPVTQRSVTPTSQATEEPSLWSRLTSFMGGENKPAESRFLESSYLHDGQKKGCGCGK